MENAKTLNMSYEVLYNRAEYGDNRWVTHSYSRTSIVLALNCIIVVSTCSLQRQGDFHMSILLSKQHSPVVQMPLTWAWHYFHVLDVCCKVIVIFMTDTFFLDQSWTYFRAWLPSNPYHNLIYNIYICSSLCLLCTMYTSNNGLVACRVFLSCF